jgi:hypothetical protein
MARGRKNEAVRRAARSVEAATAAAQTIAIRSSMLASATSPAALADPEFQRMCMEKVEAAWEAGAALIAAAPQLYAAWFELTTSQASPLSAAAGMTNAGLRFLDAGFAPLHRTVTANARRLGRRQRR